MAATYAQQVGLQGSQGLAMAPGDNVGFVPDPQLFGDALGFVGDASNDFGFVGDTPAVSNNPGPAPGSQFSGGGPADGSAITPMPRNFGESANPYGQGFTSGAQILRQFQNEPTPNVSGAVASALFPEREPDQSLVGLDAGSSPGSQEISQALGVPPSIAMPLSAVGKTVAGMGGYLTSPKGITESGIAAVPGIGLLQRAKWLYDLAANAGQTAGNLSVTLPQAWKDPNNVSPQDWQQLNDDTVNLAASMIAAGKLGEGEMEQITGVPSPRIGPKTPLTPPSAARATGPNQFARLAPANVPATPAGMGIGQTPVGRGDLLRNGGPVSQSDIDAWLGFVHDPAPGDTTPDSAGNVASKAPITPSAPTPIETKLANLKAMVADLEGTLKGSQPVAPSSTAPGASAAVEENISGNSTSGPNLPQSSQLLTSDTGQRTLTPGPGDVKITGPVGSNPGAQITTVLGRMPHLEQFANDPNIDTWAKSGRIPKEGEPLVKWSENQDWLDARIARGDKFGVATDPSTLPPVVDGHSPGRANGYFTARELYYLKQKGIPVTPMY